MKAKVDLIMLGACLILSCALPAAPAHAASAGAEQFFTVADKLAPFKAWTVEDVSDLTGAALNGTAPTRYDSSDIADRTPFRRVSVLVKPTKGRRWVRSVTLQLADSTPAVPLAEIVARYGSPLRAADNREVFRRKHDWLVCNVDSANTVRIMEITRQHQRCK